MPPKKISSSRSSYVPVSQHICRHPTLKSPLQTQCNNFSTFTILSIDLVDLICGISDPYSRRRLNLIIPCPLFTFFPGCRSSSAKKSGLWPESHGSSSPGPTLARSAPCSPHYWGFVGNHGPISCGATMFKPSLAQILPTTSMWISTSIPSISASTTWKIIRASYPWPTFTNQNSS